MTVSHRIERILCADGLIDISSAIVSENKRKVLVCLAVPFVVGDRADQIRNAVIDGVDGDLLLGITQSVVVGQIDHRRIQFSEFVVSMIRLPTIRTESNGSVCPA